MKQIFYFAAFAALLFCIGNTASAQHGRHYDSRPGQYDNYHQSRQQSFYFYPQSNVYYSFSTQQYIYPYRGSWVVSDRLPRRWHLRNEARFVITHYGFDVWNENRFHIAKFRSYRYGQPDLAYAPPQGRYYDRGNGGHWSNNDDGYRSNDWKR